MILKCIFVYKAILQAINGKTVEGVPINMGIISYDFDINIFFTVS